MEVDLPDRGGYGDEGEPPASIVRLAVARDEAFCFYYEDNLDLLREAGAEIVFFSPLRDKSLPQDTAGLYLGGGYPELYGAQLASNDAMRDAIARASEAGMPIYAECGGLMVLTQSLTDLEGNIYPMAGVLPGRARMREQLRMGYRQVKTIRDCLLLRKGETTRGHEFHYSDWVDNRAPPAAYEVVPRRGERAWTEGYAQGNLLASYVHLHFGSHAALAGNMVRACARWLDDS